MNLANLGLDQITSEPSSAMCMKRKSQKATKQQRCVLEDVKENEEDEDYRLQNTPGTSTHSIRRLTMVFVI